MTDEKQLEKWRIASKRYRISNPELTRQKCSEYKAKHPETITKNHLDYLKRTSNKLRLNPDAYRRAITSWSRAIKKRDKVCVICAGSVGLEAHHIIHKQIAPEMSLNLNNGILLCKLHHYQVHGKKLK